jgi:DNA-directed RNA polymerase specialized sigma24 family protein
MKTTTAIRTIETTIPQTDTQRQDEFDDLVVHASQGDRRAVGAIAVALGPMLLEEARTVLGEFEQDAEDVLDDFLLSLLERRARFTPAHGRATPWLCRIVRLIAQERRRERVRDWGLEDG